MEHVTRVAAAIGETQDLDRRVDYQGPLDEVGRLAATINMMLARLAAAQKVPGGSLRGPAAFRGRRVARVAHAADHNPGQPGIIATNRSR
ncbi:MAG: HAMP domain-containing protein [Desulfotomaculales bacterium]